MTVSNEDREAAITAVANELGKDHGYSCLDFPDAASDAVAALVSHGWGPKPAVSKREIERHIFHAITTFGYAIAGSDFTAIVSAAVGAVEVAGIEVIE